MTNLPLMRIKAPMSDPVSPKLDFAGSSSGFMLSFVCFNLVGSFLLQNCRYFCSAILMSVFFSQYEYNCLSVCMFLVLSIIAALLSAISSHSFCGTTNSLYQATDNRLKLPSSHIHTITQATKITN